MPGKGQGNLDRADNQSEDGSLAGKGLGQAPYTAKSGAFGYYQP